VSSAACRPSTTASAEDSRQTSASLRVKGLRAVGKYYAEHSAQIDHPATLAGMDRFSALEGDVSATYEVLERSGTAFRPVDYVVPVNPQMYVDGRGIEGGS